MIPFESDSIGETLAEFGGWTPIYIKNKKSFYTSMKSKFKIEFPSIVNQNCNQVFGVFKYYEWKGESVRAWMDEFNTLDEAQAAYPNAVFNGLGSAYQPPIISHLAPDWFDEADAGERWDDDY